MLKGNKGEWSEFYTFIKLLVDKKITNANKNLEKNSDIFFPILKITREEKAGIFEYELQEGEKVRVLDSDGEISVVNIANLKTQVATIFNSIQQSTKTFTISIAEKPAQELGIKTLNAGNSRKEDLILKIHDYTIGRDHEIGFSIKSRLGSPATLLNASGATNITYQISGLNNNSIERINAINTPSKIKDRLHQIYQEGGILEFDHLDSKIFEKNLRKIDTIMPEIVAKILLAYFSNQGKTFSELIKHLLLDDQKILNFDLSQEDYEYKLKSLLNNAALGMVPATQWDGSLRAHGGVIIIREDGELVCYSLYNAEAFRNYLFNNTRLESPSTTRHKYGVIYQENNQTFIKLNLQIRFTK